MDISLSRPMAVPLIKGIHYVLQELRAFLLQRQRELRDSDLLLSALLPESVQSVDAAGVGRLLEGVTAAMSALTSEKLRQLLMIKTSKRCEARGVCEIWVTAKARFPYHSHGLLLQVL